MVRNCSITVFVLTLCFGMNIFSACEEKSRQRSAGSEARDPGEETETLPGYLSDERKDAGSGEPAEITSEGTTVSVDTGVVTEDYTVRLRRLESSEHIISTTLIHSALSEPVQIDLYQVRTEQHLPVESLNDGVRVSALIPEKPEGTQLIALVVIDPGLSTEERGYILEEDMTIVAVNQTALSTMLEAIIRVRATNFEVMMVAMDTPPEAPWRNLTEQGISSPIRNTGDNTPPNTGADKPTVENVTSNGFTAKWNKATDNITTQERLTYRLYYSTTDNISSYEKAEANGTPAGPLTADINSMEVTSLSPLTTYYFTVVVGDEARNKKSYPVSSATTLMAFSDRDFTAVALLEHNDSVNATSPRIASNPLGDSMSVWLCGASGSQDICASRLDAKTGGWSDPVILDNLSGDIETAEVAMDLTGNAMAVWKQAVGSGKLTYASYYNGSNQAWSTAVAIEPASSRFTYFPRVTFDGLGNAYATWISSTGDPNYDVFFNWYNAAAGSWATAQMISPPNIAAHKRPSIAADPFGNTIVVWTQSDSGTINLYARWFDRNAWGDPVLLDSESGTPEPYQALFDRLGNANVGWLQNGKIFVSRKAKNQQNWNTPQAQIATGSQVTPFFAVDRNGDILAAWSSFDSSAYSIWTNRFVAATEKWNTEATSISTGDNAGTLRIAVDSSGNAIILWSDSTNFYASRYSEAEGTWSVKETAGTNAGSGFELAFDGLGNATVVYERDFPRINVYFLRFQ